MQDNFLLVKMVLSKEQWVFDQPHVAGSSHCRLVPIELVRVNQCDRLCHADRPLEIQQDKLSEPQSACRDNRERDNCNGLKIAVCISCVNAIRYDE